MYTTHLFTELAQQNYTKNAVPDVHNSQIFNCPC